MDSQGFDSELRTYYNDVKGQIKQEHSAYTAKHPELREILNDFLSTLMLEKPDNVYDYVQEYFSYYNNQKDKVLLKPLVLSGPSGAGKGKLVKTIIEKFPQKFETSISYTTRKPQLNETHGVEYFFVSKEEFEKEIKKNSFCEYCQYQGEYYGTHKGKLESIVQSCKIAVLEIDVSGARKIQQEHPDWNFIFLNSPSIQELEKRMRLQGALMPESKISERLKIAEREIEESLHLPFFHKIINDNFELCFEEFTNYLRVKYGALDK